MAVTLLARYNKPRRGGEKQQQWEIEIHFPCNCVGVCVYGAAHIMFGRVDFLTLTTGAHTACKYRLQNDTEPAKRLNKPPGRVKGKRLDHSVCALIILLRYTRGHVFPCTSSCVRARVMHIVRYHRLIQYNRYVHFCIVRETSFKKKKIEFRNNN